MDVVQNYSTDDVLISLWLCGIVVRPGAHGFRVQSTSANANAREDSALRTLFSSIRLLRLSVGAFLYMWVAAARPTACTVWKSALFNGYIGIRLHCRQAGFCFTRPLVTSVQKHLLADPFNRAFLLSCVCLRVNVLYVDQSKVSGFLKKYCTSDNQI